MKLKPGHDATRMEAVVALQLLHLLAIGEILPANRTGRILFQHFFCHFHRGNVCNVFLGHGRRASSIHVVQQLSDDGIKTTPSPGVVPWISVQLNSQPTSSSRIHKVKLRTSRCPATLKTRMGSCSKLHTRKIYNKVLKSIL